MGPQDRGAGYLSMRTLIVANGTPPAPRLLREQCQAADLVICADGAIRTFAQNGLAPDILVGDFDSSTAAQRSEFPNVETLHRPDQDHTDLDKCLELALEYKAKEVHLCGILGRRLDHELSNLSSAEAYAGKFQIIVEDEYGWGIFLCADNIPVEKSFICTPGQVVSLISFSGANSVTTSGLQYPLDGEPLKFGKRLGISNVALAEKVGITLTQGALLIYFPVISWSPAAK